MTKPKWYHYLLAAGSQDPDNPNPRLYSPLEEARAYAEKDNKKLNQIHSEQLEYEKKTAPIKAKVAATTLGYMIAPEAMPWLILGAEDAANIYHAATQPIDSPRPASIDKLKSDLNNNTLDHLDKLNTVVDFGITTAGLTSAFKPMFSHIMSGKGTAEVLSRLKEVSKAFGKASILPIGTGIGIGVSGMQEENPVLAEVLLQSSGYAPFLSHSYKNVINNMANKYRKTVPSIASSNGNIIKQHTVHLEDTGQGAKYIGVSAGKESPQKDWWSKFGANAPLQNDSKIILHKKDNVDEVWDLRSQSHYFENIPGIIKQ